MGIPSFFNHIITRYGLVTSAFQNDCHALYIDFNCILHKFAYINSQKYVEMPLDELEKNIMDESISYLWSIYKIISPKDFMYIAIDGICPRAKMVQQRKRRYISSWRKSLVENDAEYRKMFNIKWDSNCITPGTNFMNLFEKRITYAFSNLISKKKVYISGSTEIGEGEHKIYNFIKENLCKNDDYSQRNNIIYGLDADLILLSLLNLKNNHTITLMREACEFDKKKKQYESFNYLNINLLKQSLFDFYFEDVIKNNLLLDYGLNLNSDINSEIFARDYVILCTFLGNDFLPPLSFIKVKNNGIDFVVNEYKKLRESYKNNLVDKDGNINDNFLKQLVRNMSINEDEHMKNAHNQYIQRRNPPCFQNIRFSYEKTLFDIDNYPSFHKIGRDQIDIAQKSWRNQYYQTLFFGEMVNEICQNYCEGLKWVIDYYILQNPLLDWSYKYNYSPTILDLANFLEYEMEMTQKISINSIIKNTKINLLSNDAFKEKMSSGILQLFMVLPPSSNYLIPNEKLRHIMCDISCGCLHYFPTGFKISTFLKNYLWECSAILPELDILYIDFMIKNTKGHF